MSNGTPDAPNTPGALLKLSLMQDVVLHSLTLKCENRQRGPVIFQVDFEADAMQPPQRRASTNGGNFHHDSPNVPPSPPDGDNKAGICDSSDNLMSMYETEEERKARLAATTSAHSSKKRTVTATSPTLRPGKTPRTTASDEYSLPAKHPRTRYNTKKSLEQRLDLNELLRGNGIMGNMYKESSMANRPSCCLFSYNRDRMLRNLRQCRPFTLRVHHMAWVVGRFYGRGNWRFSNGVELREYFIALVVSFDERWPLRVEIFPHTPLEIALDSSQQEELEKKKVELRRYLLRLWCWVDYGWHCFEIDFGVGSELGG
ncbi:hypothetical protein J3R83DRAFT_2435 [Lanmaoa asiatica]|nr:hypothetical protein J3R83DRAFT_2435 [Lanmaoa asiatica]